MPSKKTPKKDSTEEDTPVTPLTRKRPSSATPPPARQRGKGRNTPLASGEKTYDEDEKKSGSAAYSSLNTSTDGLARTEEDVKTAKYRQTKELQKAVSMEDFWRSQPPSRRDAVRNWQQMEQARRPDQPKEVMEEGMALFGLSNAQYSWLLFHPFPVFKEEGFFKRAQSEPQRRGANNAPRQRDTAAAPPPPVADKKATNNLWRVNRHAFIDPELFFRSSAQTLLVMCVTAWFLAGPPHENDPLARVLGYHGFLCTVSTAPAIYVLPLMFCVFSFFSARFVLTDIVRIQQEYVEKRTLSPMVYGLCYLTDVIYGLCSGGFIMVFVIPPTPSTLWQHCGPFLALVLSRWLAMFTYMIRYVQPTYGQWLTFALNTFISLGYVACVALDLEHQPQPGGTAHINPEITRFFDYAWFGMLWVAYLMLPRQARLECTVGLESFEPPHPITHPVPEEEDVKGEPNSIVGKWIDNEDTPPFDSATHSHIWNWEVLNTWRNFQTKVFMCDITTGFLNYGVNQFDNKCLDMFTLVIYYIVLVVFDIAFIPALFVGFAAWVVYVLFLTLCRLMEMLGLCTVKQTKVDKITLYGGKYPHLEAEDVWVARPVPTDLELDFVLYRVPGYLMNLIMSYPIAFARLLSGRSRPPIIPDSSLNLVGLGSWVAHLLAQKDDNDQSKGYFMDCRMLRHVENFEKNYTNAERVNFSACGDVESIVIRVEPPTGTNKDGTKNYNTVEVKPGDLCWPLAKAHLQGSMITMGLCWAHNWQHFVFPDLGAAAQQRLNPESTLAKLLAPHLRFTIRINQVRDHGSAIENFDTWSYYLRVYILLPMTSSEFLVHNSVKTNVFYYPDNAINDGPRRFELAGSEKTLSQFRIPPFDGVTAAKDAYHYMLYAYYKVIRKFVARVWPNIDPKDWEQWLDFVGPKMPILRVAEPIDVLATLIWTVSVVHSGDHASLGEGRAYWMSAVNRPWNAEDCKNPRDVFDRWTYCRTQSFFDTYGTFWRNPILTLRLGSTHHDFVETNLIEADEQLRRDLARTDKELHQAGCAVLPLAALVECLCF